MIEHLDVVDSYNLFGVDVEANPCRQLAIHMKQEIERIISLSDPYDPPRRARGWGSYRDRRHAWKAVPRLHH